MKIFAYVITILVVICLIYLLTMCNTEKFQGALQSLYSNDGIQDDHLTIPPAERYYYDPYKYWRGLPWNLPTRNLDRIFFYPYLYEYNIDRYARLYPYW